MVTYDNALFLFKLNAVSSLSPGHMICMDVAVFSKVQSNEAYIKVFKGLCCKFLIEPLMPSISSVDEFNINIRVLSHWLCNQRHHMGINLHEHYMSYEDISVSVSSFPTFLLFTYCISSLIQSQCSITFRWPKIWMNLYIKSRM